MTAVVPEPVGLTISGYSDKPTSGVAMVTHYDRGGRLRRAAAGLAVWWGVAVAGAFIPVAHFLLVPGFGVFGLLVFFRRLGTERVIGELRGTCPDCGAEQAFDVQDRWAPPFNLTCKECGRGLKARVEHGSS